MKINDEINRLKKDVELLKVRISKLNKTGQQLKKMISSRGNTKPQKKTRRITSYINWLDNERRTKVILPPE